MNLGEIIDTLEIITKKAGDTCPVLFDFGAFAPDVNDIGSYRGYYSDLAIGYIEYGGYGSTTVSDLLKALKKALKEKHYGYKGGEYFMGRETMVWVANHSKTTSTQISQIDQQDHYIIVHTEYVPW